MTLPSRISAYIFLSLGIVIIGFTAIFVRWANAPGTVSAFYRMAIASAAMAIPFLVHLHKNCWTLPSRGILFAAAGGVCFGTDIAFWMTGVMMGDPTTPTLMANTSPIWVGLTAWLFLKERQRFRFWAGLMLSLAGAGLILSQNFSSSIRLGMGAVLGLIASFFYAAFHLFSQKGRQFIGTLAYFWIFTTTGALVLLLINLCLHRPLTGYGEQALLNFLIIGLVGHVGGWLCIGYAQGHLRASLIAPSVLGQPVVTALLAWLFFGDTFTLLQILGGAGVIYGIYVVHGSHSV